MRRGKIRKFGKVKRLRESLMRSLATALIDNGKIKTTSAKAKVLSSHVSHLVTIAKKEDLASRRELLLYVGTKASQKLVKEIMPTMKDRKGGYVRITRLGQRRSDAAPMALVEFTSR